MRRSLVLFVLAGFLPLPLALPAAVRKIDFAALIGRSDAVVYGRVLSSRCFFDPSTKTIWTETEIGVIDAPKGRTPSRIRISEPGGVIGDVAHLFPGVPRLGAGQEAVLFVYRSAGRRLRLTGLWQGVWPVEMDPASRIRFTRPVLDDIEVRQAGRVPAGIGSRARPNRQRLDEFLGSIRKKAAER